MLLSKWLDREGISRSEFAGRVGVSPAHITGLCDGASWPGRKVVRAIERETGGEVTANDFVALGAAPSPSNPSEPERATPSEAA